MIEIEREKQTEMSEHAEQILRHAGKLMQCLEEISEEGSMGMRMGNRENMGYRDDAGYREYGGSMGERRGVRGTGRYGRRDPYYEY